MIRVEHDIPFASIEIKTPDGVRLDNLHVYGQYYTEGQIVTMEVRERRKLLARIRLMTARRDFDFSLDLHRLLIDLIPEERAKKSVAEAMRRNPRFMASLWRGPA